MLLPINHLKNACQISDNHRTVPSNSHWNQGSLPRNSNAPALKLIKISALPRLYGIPQLLTARFAMNFTKIFNVKLMISLTVVGLVLTSFAPCSNAQDWARKMFKEFTHDFGNVPKGDRPEFRFEIENIYEEPIQIRQVFSSCGCTSVSLTKNVLQTWEKGEVVCKFNSHAFDGFKQATVTVRFDRPFVGEVQLTVKGNIVSAVSFKPEAINFGQVSPKNSPQQITMLEHRGNPTFRVLDVKSTFPHIKVNLRETMRSATGVAYEMRTQLKESAPVGFTQGELYVIVEENGRRSQMPLKFNAKVGVSSIKISPEILTLNDIPPGESVTKKVIVRSDEPFEITDVKCRTLAFKVREKDRGKKKTHIVEVTYTGEENPGMNECELSFFTDLTNAPSGKVKAIIASSETDGSSEEISTSQSN